MSRAANAEHSTDPLNHIMGCWTRRLINQYGPDQESPSRRIEFNNSLIRNECSRPRSSSK